MTLWADLADAYKDVSKEKENLSEDAAKAYLSSEGDIAKTAASALIPGEAARQAEAAQEAKTAATAKWNNEHPGQGEFNQDVSPGQSAADAAGAQGNPKPFKGGGKTDPASPESTWEQLANDQAEQYLKDTQAIAPYASGTAIPSTDQAMASSAAALIGASSSSPISQWLNQQSKAAQAQYGPTEAAGANVEKAEQAGENLIAGGMQQMGQAETALMAAAPYQQLLSSLAAEVPYHLSEGYSFPGLTGQNVQGGIQSAEQYLGISTAGQGTGVTAPSLPAPTTNPAATNTLINPDLPSGGGQT